MKSASKTAGNLEQLYRNRLDAIAAYRLRVWKTLVDKFFSRYVGTNSVVLDLGCGYGEFINNIRCRKKLAIDLNADARRHLSPDVVFLEQDCSQPWDIADATLDVVFSSNFFEHLPSKEVLSDILAQAFRCLR